MRPEAGDGAGSGQDEIRFGSSRGPRPRLARWNLPRYPLVRRLAAVAVIAAVAAAVAILVRSPAGGGAASSGKTPAAVPAGQWYAVGSPVAVKALRHPFRSSIRRPVRSAALAPRCRQ